mgnify:CR=1 FL=1
MGLAHSLRLTRIDVRRMLRKRTAPDNRLASVVSVGLYALLTLGLTGAGAWGGHALGQALTAGSVGLDPAVLRTGARGGVGVVWLVLVAIFGVRAVGQRGTLTNAAGVLTTVPASEAYLALVASEYVYLLVWTLLPAAGAGIGLAVGAGLPWLAVGIPLALALAGATAVATAIALGLAIRHAVTRFPFVARHKTALIVVVFVGYLVTLITGSLGRLMFVLFEPMAASPVGWYADLALVGLATVPFEPTRAGGAVVATVAVVPVAIAAGTWVAGRHWFADPVLAGEDGADDQGARTALEPTNADSDVATATGATTDEAASDSDAGQAPPTDSRIAPPATEDGVARRLEAIFDRPTAALVALAWRRAGRTPLKLMYAAYPLFFGTGVFVDVVQTGQIPAYLPYGLLVFFAWAGGVVFTLNPLGDQGAVLATTLLSEVTGHRFVSAHVVAGLVVVVPIGTLAVALTAVLSPVTAQRSAILIGLAPVSMVVAATLSIGIGTAFPRFEATNVTRSMEAVVPSPWAFLLFSLHVVATTVSALFVALPGARSVGATALSVVASLVLGGNVSVSQGVLYWGSLVVLVVLLLLPAVSYRYAVRSFDQYEIA